MYKASSTKILAHFPAKSRDNLESECNIVQRCCMGAPDKANEQGTVITRRTHFIYWCTIRGIIGSIFPLITLSPIGIIYMLAFYAAFLATGHAISYKSIKSGTVTKYIGDIANFLRNFANNQSSNIHKVGNTVAHQISSTTKEMKRFEDKPNR